MPNYTNAEKTRLRAAVMEAAYPVALQLRLSPSQFEDIVGRALAMNKLWLKADDTLTGWEVSQVIDALRDDPKNAHLFNPVDGAPQKANGDDFQARFGMSKAEFEALPARRRLDLANEEAAKTKGRN
ncbi:MAG: hypothetical protein JNL45_12470 [Hyphomicrobium sp.]|nr:hypothetical protein [Hyphomicrobium sp.]